MMRQDWLVFISVTAALVACNVASKEELGDRTQRQTQCDPNARYSNPDGTCNNLHHPSWGSVGQPFLRLLDPVYEDGVQIPRMTTNNATLPSPRSVSTHAHDFDFQRLGPGITVMLMEWGQFLAHDLTETPKPEDIKCCNVSLVTGHDLHADVTTGGPCFPIIIGEGDHEFASVDDRCMEFARSDSASGDGEVRQQMNLHSAYLDGTNVYGRNEAEMNALRTSSGGKLRVVSSSGDDHLPPSSDNYCLLSDDDNVHDYCLQAGDNRVNDYPPLGAMHTIFARYHNYIAEQLAHRHHDDDEIFHLARKIVIAVMQKITYDEYLPVILGFQKLSDYGLDSPYVYNDSCDATLYNVFSTAAFRFGHSMVPDGLWVDGQYIRSVDLFRRPELVLTKLDSLVAGMVSNHTERIDRWYSQGMTDHLFEEHAHKGFDAAAYNLQRGRDHGLPPYNKWRELCGLYPITDFSQLPVHAVHRYNVAYNGDPDAIDLYSGGLSEPEDVVPGGLVGPTFACLLGKQFANLRNCDRYWWETHNSVTGFSNERQRRQIRRTHLSHVLCRTTNPGPIQERVFRFPDPAARNHQVDCSTILAHEMDFSVF